MSPMDIVNNSNEILPTSAKGKKIIRRELKKRPAFVLKCSGATGRKRNQSYWR